MKKIFYNIVGIFYISTGLSLATQIDMAYIEGQHYAHAALIIKEKNKIIVENGKCDDRHAPFSTFKVPLVLMGFDSKFIETKDLPKLPYKEAYFQGEYSAKLGDWYNAALGSKYNWLKDQTPATYMKNSVIWFSHQITQNLGEEKFQEYVTTLNYGNMNVSGIPGRYDGLLNSWLGNSLEISPREQVEFLEKLLANTLKISKDAQEKTKETMDREELWDDWKLYGKTGGGRNGWFIGWIEKNGRRVVFAQYIELIDPSIKLTAGPIAKEIAKKNILKILKK